MTRPLPMLPWWKAILAGGYLSLFFTFLIWLFNSLLLRAYQRLPTSGEISLGLAVFPLYLWMWWASKVNKARMLWLSNLCLSGYVASLLVVGGARLLARSLPHPWGLLAAGSQVLLTIGLSALFLSSPRLGRMVYQGTTRRLWILAALLGGSGAGGALIGMYAARYGKVAEVELLLGVAFSVLGAMMLLGSLGSLWPSRPWAQEEEP